MQHLRNWIFQMLGIKDFMVECLLILSRSDGSLLHSRICLRFYYKDLSMAGSHAIGHQRVTITCIKVPGTPCNTPGCRWDGRVKSLDIKQSNCNM